MPDCRVTSPPSKLPSTVSFQFLDASDLPDNKLICIASDRRISSRRAFSPGARRVGAGRRWPPWSRQRSRYNKTRCFETFPFPAATTPQQARIRALAEQLDAHRKRQQALHPGADADRHVQRPRKNCARRNAHREGQRHPRTGPASRAAQLHDELDTAVLDAYGWSDLAPTDRAALLSASSPSTPNAPRKKPQAKSAGCVPITRTQALR